MVFLGLNIDNSKKYSQTVQIPLKITGCTLRTFKKGRTTLKVTVDEQTFVLGHLHAEKMEQLPLDITFAVGEVVTFECEGANDISLIGDFLITEEDMDQMDGDFQYVEQESDCLLYTSPSPRD